jgi:hypothetical protein
MFRLPGVSSLRQMLGCYLGRNMRAARMSVALAATATAVLAASCQETTQVVILPRTNLRYDAARRTSVAIYVGTPGAIDPQTPGAITDTPWGDDGLMGSLAALPTGDKDAPVEVRVVMGIAKDPTLCSDASPQGCIVSRRLLRYVKHTTLRLPITLYLNCQGVRCDADSTCNVAGQCVSARIDPNACASAQGCVLEGDPPGGAGVPQVSPLGDGGTSDAQEASVSDTGPADTGPADTGPADTGPADTGTDAPAGDASVDGGDAGELSTLASPRAFGTSPFGMGPGWFAPSVANIGASDNSYALCGSFAELETTEYLRASDFGFAVPPGATIRGVTAEIEHKHDDQGSQFTAAINSARLIGPGGSLIGAAKSDSMPLPKVDAYRNLGNAQDLWGAALTPAIVNDPGFGLAISYVGTQGSIYVDHVRLRVFYSVP